MKWIENNSPTCFRVWVKLIKNALTLSMQSFSKVKSGAIKLAIYFPIFELQLKPLVIISQLTKYRLEISPKLQGVVAAV